MTERSAPPLRCAVKFTEQQLELIEKLRQSGRAGRTIEEVIQHGVGEFLKQETYHQPDGRLFQSRGQTGEGGTR